MNNPTQGRAVLTCGARGGAKPVSTDGYRRVKETKRRGMDGWKSEHSVVPTKPGNTPEWTRWREASAEQQNRARE